MKEGDWCIFYDDGTTFSSEDGSPEEAPYKGVQVIIEKRNGKNLDHSMNDLYCWLGFGWDCAASHRKRWPDGAPLVGTRMEPDEFWALKKKALGILNAKDGES